MFNRGIRTEYEMELLKQTDPYAYFVEYVENEHLKKDAVDNNKGEHENVPFICVTEKDGYRVYDADDYFIYESTNGISSDVEKLVLLEFSRKLNSDLTYSDSDFITGDGKRHTPFFKPDWSPETYESYDYISEFYAVKKCLKDADFTAIEDIKHISKVLFHVASDKTTSEIYDDFAKSISKPDYEGTREQEDENVSVIIPSKDNPDVLRECLKSLNRAKVKSQLNQNEPLEVILVDNGSSDDNVLKIKAIFAECDALKIEYIYEKDEFNYSFMCNKGASASTGKYLLFMNDDIEVIDDMFILKLLHFARREKAGAVSTKLIYPNSNIIQHDGITDLKMCGPTHKLMSHNDSENFYFGYNRMNRNSLAVTGACLMVDREKYFKIGGFYDKMKVGYNDVDLCISLYEKGFSNILVNDAVLYHHESISRGSDIENKDKFSRLKRERAMLYERHPFLREKGDPFYNVNLVNDSLDYTVNVVADCNRRDYRSEKREELLKFAKKHIHKPHKRGFMSVDNTSIELGVFDEGDALTVNGWGILNKRDNIYYDRYLVLYKKTEDISENKDNQIAVYSVASNYRPDLVNVFNEAVNILLGGFIAKVPYTESNSLFSKIDEIGYGMIFISKLTGKKYYAEYE